MEKTVSGKQESFLNREGRVATHVVSQNQKLDVETTFSTPEQQQKALELIRSGQAKDARGAQVIMQREEAGDSVNDMYKH